MATAIASAMTCKFEKRYMGTIALTLDFGANNVEVARYQDTETAGVFHLNVISKTLVKWTRLPHKAFPKAFADTLVWAYGPGNRRTLRPGVVQPGNRGIDHRVRR